MAVAANFVNLEVPGASKVGMAEVSFTANNDYVTNGISPIAAILAAAGFTRVEDICPVIIGPTLTAGIADLSWDKANQKLKLYTSGAVELANALDISSIKVYFYVKGR